MKLQVELLENRETPSSVLFQNGQLLILGDMNKSNVAVVDSVGTDTRVRLNGQEQSFQNVAYITMIGGNKADDFSNNTSINATIIGNDGNDTIIGGVGNDIIDAGNGKDVVYDLLGVNTINAKDNQPDRVYTNAASLAAVDAKDQFVNFFATGRTPGTGVVSLEQGVLYITPTNNGSSLVINQLNNKIVVTYNFNDGLGVKTLFFNKNDVKTIAYFGGTGNDLYVNNTKIEEAAYGSAGNDVIVSGFGDFNLLKGSGGDDVLIARGKRADLTGNSGTDFLFGCPGRTTYRTDAFDLIFGFGKDDLLVMS